MSRKSTVHSPQLPFVLINMAMTADGKIATANRAVHSFGSPRDLGHLYALRATTDAIICGARTVEISESIMDNGSEKFRQRRLKNGLAENNIRVIVSGSGSIHPDAAIFKQRFSPILALTTERISKLNLQKIQSVADDVRICGNKEIDFLAALRWLREKWHVKRLLCEGGGELNDALFRADLVDEVHLTICPNIFGGRMAPTIADGLGFQSLAAASKFKLTRANRGKAELFTVF